MIGSRTRCPPARNTPSLSRTSRRHGHGGCTSRTTGSGDASAISAAAVETCTAGEAAICRGPRRRTHQRPCGSPPTCPGSSPAAVQARRSPGPSPRRPPAAAGVRGRRAPVAAGPPPGACSCRQPSAVEAAAACAPGTTRRAGRHKRESCPAAGGLLTWRASWSAALSLSSHNRTGSLPRRAQGFVGRGHTRRRRRRPVVVVHGVRRGRCRWPQARGPDAATSAEAASARRRRRPAG